MPVLDDKGSTTHQEIAAPVREHFDHRRKEHEAERIIRKS